MSNETLRIRVETTDEFFDALTDAAAAIEEGNDVDDTEVVSVPDLATMSRVLSETNLELIRAIAEHDPSSMRETSRLVERDIKNVSEDLHFLHELGIVEIETTGRAKRPVVPYDDIEVDIPVRGDSDGRDNVVA